MIKKLMSLSLLLLTHSTQLWAETPRADRVIDQGQYSKNYIHQFSPSKGTQFGQTNVTEDSVTINSSVKNIQSSDTQLSSMSNDLKKSLNSDLKNRFSLLICSTHTANSMKYTGGQYYYCHPTTLKWTVYNL